MTSISRPIRTSVCNASTIPTIAMMGAGSICMTTIREDRWMTEMSLVQRMTREAAPNFWRSLRE